MFYVESQPLMEVLQFFWRLPAGWPLELFDRSTPVGPGKEREIIAKIWQCTVDLVAQSPRRRWMSNGLSSTVAISFRTLTRIRRHPTGF